jgi:hypothetical protein
MSLLLQLAHAAALESFAAVRSKREKGEFRWARPVDHVMGSRQRLVYEMLAESLMRGAAPRHLERVLGEGSTGKVFPLETGVVKLVDFESVCCFCAVSRDRIVRSFLRKWQAVDFSRAYRLEYKRLHAYFSRNI